MSDELGHSPEHGIINFHQVNREIVLLKSQLTDEQLHLIRDRSAGLLTIDEFMAQTSPGERPTPGEPARGYTLGTWEGRSGELNHTITEALGFTPGRRVYDNMLLTKILHGVLPYIIPRRSDTPPLDPQLVALEMAELVRKLTATGKPIVFFVPDGVLGRQGYTAEEMRSFLRHPDKMAHTTFVLGLGDLMSDDEHADLCYHYPESQERTAVLREAFRSRLDTAEE